MKTAIAKINASFFTASNQVPFPEVMVIISMVAFFNFLKKYIYMCTHIFKRYQYILSYMIYICNFHSQVTVPLIIDLC